MGKNSIYFDKLLIYISHLLKSIIVDEFTVNKYVKFLLQNILCDSDLYEQDKKFCNYFYYVINKNEKIDVEKITVDINDILLTSNFKSFERFDDRAKFYEHHLLAIDNQLVSISDEDDDEKNAKNIYVTDGIFFLMYIAKHGGLKIQNILTNKLFDEVKTKNGQREIFDYIKETVMRDDKNFQIFNDIINVYKTSFIKIVK